MWPSLLLQRDRAQSSYFVCTGTQETGTLIPKFDGSGNLPKGIHRASLDEVRDILGSISGRREWLFERLRAIVELAQSTEQVERLFIWGSFVSKDEFPHDIDLLLIMKEAFVVEDINIEAKKLFDHVQARLSFNADIFWARSSIGQEVIDLWLETYQITRDFQERGILEVIINDY